MIRLVLSDVDDTILPLGERRVSDRLLAAIERVREAGVEFGLATGRDVYELETLFGGTSAFDTGILSNGKKIRVGGQDRRVALIDNAALQRLADRIAPDPGVFVCAYPRVSSIENPVSCIGVIDTQEERTRVEETGRRYLFQPTIANRVPDEELIAATIACRGTQERLDAYKEMGAQLCPEFDFVQPGPNWCDIVPRGLNKGTALPLLLDELALTADEVVFFGDAGNDLALLQGVSSSVAVANATPDASAAARYHIGRCEDDAVALALEQIAAAVPTGELPAFMRA